MPSGLHNLTRATIVYLNIIKIYIFFMYIILHAISLAVAAMSMRQRNGYGVLNFL